MTTTAMVKINNIRDNTTYMINKNHIAWYCNTGKYVTICMSTGTRFTVDLEEFNKLCIY